MKNKIQDLRNHMFAALERLGDENISEEDLKKEIGRSKAISDVGKVIVESVKSQILYEKMRDKQFSPASSSGTNERIAERAENKNDFFEEMGE